MRWLFLLGVLIPGLLQAQQPRIKNKKYQGLLWEITGNGLQKPSYLFGTMHVSSKVAFHLADSFYLGIRGADIVALETNPETWQEDMDKYNSAMRKAVNLTADNSSEMPRSYFRINSLKFGKYDKKMEEVLQSSPGMINSLLYRTHGNESSDFEEDTFLDMYIYQCGKRWGKKVAGVENYDESMRLMAEAYRDAVNDKGRKQIVFDRESGFTSDRLQESYRTGNLDWLDSINRYNSASAAFDEKFIYQRNEIQANSIDSIIRSGLSLFVGVGAAHLPGDRGVIELLRAKGYKLRAVKMGVRDSEHKSQVEKLRVPVTFTTWNSEDGYYQVDLPGQLYEFTSMDGIDQRQYADMANGSYYVVTRIMTNAWLWDHSVNRVIQVVDSLLYENVPGKILSKEKIEQNGHPGLDIVNRTRRGDMQRYQIFVTPFEILVFKMSGNGDYVQNGDEAERFFRSIRLKIPPARDQLETYAPLYAGFSAVFPHQPFVGNDGNWIYDAVDAGNNVQYRVIRSDVHNYYFAEEDSFDLGLMEESFAASEYIDRRISRRNTLHQGYPALDVQYRDKAGKLVRTRFLIRGPHYYTLVARAAKNNPSIDRFFGSFKILPYQYGASVERADTALYYTVQSPVFPDFDSSLARMPLMQLRDEELGKSWDPGAAISRSRIVEHDTTGEKIFVSFDRPGLYEDEIAFMEEEESRAESDSAWIVRRKKQLDDVNGFRVMEWMLSDSGSTRAFWIRKWMKDGLVYNVVTQIDTLSQPSAFQQQFFHTFKPVDSVKGLDRDRNRVALFFGDLMRGDSLARRRAINGLENIKLDSSHLDSLKLAIQSLDWKEKDYMNSKKAFIGKLSGIAGKKTSDYLVQLYHAAGDTVVLQYAALESLLRQHTPYAYQQFRDIVSNEPPVVEKSGDYSYYSSSIPRLFRTNISRGRNYLSFSSPNGEFMDELSDSLALTRTIIPDLLPLLNLEPYKLPVMQLMTEMIDSSLLRAEDYQSYYSKFLLEAKMEFRTQLAKSRQASMDKARKEQEGNDLLYGYLGRDNEKNSGNLPEYARLLLPFWEQKPAVPAFINQILKDGEKSLRFDIFSEVVKKDKPVPDSLLDVFAANDKYRYPLYILLKSVKKEARFPARYNNHKDLARSELSGLAGSYTKIDSIVYLDRLPARELNRKGYVYFFKYTEARNSNIWKIGSVGLVPADPKLYEWPGEESWRLASRYLFLRWYSGSDWNELSDARLRNDEPVKEQLEKQLRKLNVGTRRSGARFYDEGNYNNRYLDYGY